MAELFQVIKDSSSTGIALSPINIFLNLSLALILGWIYSYVYRITYSGSRKDKQLKREMKSMQYTILLLTVGGALIWIVVADNLVRAFGLAGALSLIRFRTVLREPMNTTKVFYAIILGMACGLSQYYTAIIGTMFVCLVLGLIYLVVKKEKAYKKTRRHDDDSNEKFEDK
jgi:preprotein translocase subunit SecY